MIKKGLLGGSFDPVHAGHIGMALSALRELGLDEVILQPNRIPYYKKQAEVSDADRLEMLRIAVAETGKSECQHFHILSVRMETRYFVRNFLTAASLMQRQSRYIASFSSSQGGNEGAILMLLSRGSRW